MLQLGIRQIPEAQIMSLDRAREWARTALVVPDAQEHAIQRFEEAESSGVVVTLIAGPRLVTDRKCYLARWTGNDFVTIRLTPKLQADFKVKDTDLFQQFEVPRVVKELPVDRRVELSDVDFDLIDKHNHQQPWSGTCSFSVDDRLDAPIVECALRAEYFRPDLPQSVSTFWRPNISPLPSAGQMRFHFVPLAALTNPLEIVGAVIVFLQLFTEDYSEGQVEMQPISNVVGDVVGDRWLDAD